MSNDPILYTLETAPPAITALSTRDGMWSRGSMPGGGPPMASG